jgi:HNH endonuclease
MAVDTQPLTIERLKYLLEYYPESGHLVWRITSGRSKAGEQTGCLHVHGYLLVGIDGKVYKSHRLAWAIFYGYWPISQLDHANGDRADNRICNLREATNSQNGWNCKVRKHSKSGIKGLRWNPQRKKWEAEIRANHQRFRLGRFDCLGHALKTRAAAVKQHHGEFARIT